MKEFLGNLILAGLKYDKTKEACNTLDEHDGRTGIGRNNITIIID